MAVAVQPHLAGAVDAVPAMSAPSEFAVRALLKREFASYLHDTVLQTLSLMQSPRRTLNDVRKLARVQECELRAWLSVVDAHADQSLGGALRRLASEVGRTYGVAIDVVTAANCEPEPVADSLLLAAREALVNAAKHSESERVDVYAAATSSAVSVWIRDRGVGFDVTKVPSNRWGVARSICRRMASAGGAAAVKSSLGEGTEVHLTLPRRDAGDCV